MTHTTLVETGRWAEDIAWELHRADELPPAELCTAAFCVAIHDGNIVLAKVRDRGWGMLGGHIEPGETVHDAMLREALEEGGFVPHEPLVFAHRKIISTKPTQHPDGQRMYPFPISYIVYFAAITRHEIVPPTGAEIETARTFHLDEIRAMGLHDLSTIELALSTARIA